MAEVSSTGLAESYELVTADACPSGLPVNPIRDEYTIGRFVELSIAQGGGGNPVPPRAVTAVIPRDVVAPGLLDAYARLNPGATLTEMKGGTALVDEWNEPIEAPAPPEEPPLARPVFVSDVDELIATRVIELDGEKATVQLDRAAIAALLSTGAAVVPVKNGKGRELVSIVTTPPAMAGANDGKDAEVSDLAEFLEQPLVSKSDGSLEVADLTAENVEELRKGETTQVSTPSGSDILSLITSTHRLGGQATAVEDAPQLTVYEAADPSDIERFHAALAQSLPAFALALYLPFQQRWELLGYSRGALLNSVSLAPQEDTTIEIFSWDRRKRSVERTSTSELDVESDVSTTTKDSDEVIKEVTRDSSFHAQAGGQLSVAAIGLTIGGGIDSKSAVKDVAKATHNHIEDTVEKTAAKVKASRQTKISEAVESGREERITRKVRNPNLCHALTLDYFEVLANYVVRTRFEAAAARLCVLVENPVDFAVDRRLLRVHEDTLRPALLAPSLAEGFEAARLLEARDRACAVACHQCECAPRRPSAGQTGAEATAAWEAVRQALLQFAKQPVSLLANAMPDRYYQAVHAGERAVFSTTSTDFHRWLYLQALSQAGFDAFVRRFIAVVGAVALGNQALLNERWFAEDFWWQVQSLPDAVLNTAELHAAQKDQLWEGPVRLSLAARGYDPDLYGVASMAKWATYYRLEDSGMPSAVARFKAAYKAYDAALAAAGKTSEQVAAAALALDKEATAAIAETYPLEQVTRAAEREDALIEHIKANKPYYRFVMWRSLDARTQRQRLSPGGAAFGRLVAPEAVGHYGDRLAFPVALSAHEQLKKWFSDNLAANTEVTGITGERRVALPTPGVAMETRLSHCDACEDYIRDQRGIDLRTRAAQAAKEEREAERYGQRLKQQPPLLEDPDRPDGPVRVELTQTPPQQR